VVKNQHFAPTGKTMNWIEKWLTHFRMGTTSSTTMQSLEKIEQRAPAVGVKIWCLYVYRQDAAKRQTAGIEFTHGSKISIFAPHGRLVAPIHVKFCTA